MTEKITEEEIADAFGKIESGEAGIADLLSLYTAAGEQETELLPSLLIDAIDGVFRSQSEYDNGGADQFVWNYGSEVSKSLGETWRLVGAIENGELLIRLSAGLETYKSQFKTDFEFGVDHFLQFRKSVKGPFFGVPEPIEEVSEAATEWAIEHFKTFDLVGK